VSPRQYIHGTDQVGIFFVALSEVAVSKSVNRLKGVLSHLVQKKNYPSIQQQLWGNILWSSSYLAGNCGGAPIAVTRQYIAQQQTPP